LEPDHLFAGICLGCTERVVAYWKNADVLEELLDHDFQVSEPRFYYWIRMYRMDHRRIFRRKHPQIWTLSADCQKVEDAAIAYARSRCDSRHEQSIVVVPEDYLLAMARLGLPISQKLIASGIELAKLEQAVGV